MKTLPSFDKNHNTLEPGLYECRRDFEFVRTWDCRFHKPNTAGYPSVATLHTFEHLCATYFKCHSALAGKVVSVNCGMCRTCLYVETTSDVTIDQLVAAFLRMACWVDSLTSVPGARKAECGNYRCHNLKGARGLIDSFCVTLIQQFNLCKCS